MIKRITSSLLACALCCVMVIGSLSFSFASAADPAAPSVSVEPFFLSIPQLPDGYFDGDILANGDNYSISLDFSNLSSSISGSSETESQSFEHYTFTVPNTSVSGSTSESSTVVNGWWNWVNGVFWNAMTDEVFIPDDDYWDGSWGTGDDGDPSGGFGYTEQSNGRVNLTINGVTITGQTTTTQDYISEYNLSSDYFGTVSGSVTSSIDTSDHKRFRTFSLISASSSYPTRFRYYWLLVDARCQISASVSSYDSSSGLYTLSISCTSPVNTLKVSSIFSLTGSYSGRNVSNSSSYTFSFSSPCFWISDNFPPFSAYPNFVSGTSPFREAVFGKETLLFQYLNTIHSDLNTIHSDLTSLTSSMQSAISNQTSTLQNMTADPATQPSTSQIANYFAESSVFDAPSSDSFFSGSLSSAPMWSGVTWWSSKFNDIIVSNQVIVAFTTAMLTLGLAVFIIGRRVNMK